MLKIIFDDNFKQVEETQETSSFVTGLYFQVANVLNKVLMKYNDYEVIMK